MELPNKCPHCFSSIRPEQPCKDPFKGICILGGSIQSIKYIPFQCPVDTCRKCFIGIYNADQYGTPTTYEGILRIGKEKQTFPEDINSVSEKFQGIYNEAFHAEQDGLLEICGGGYRKALEYLIKDFIIHNNPESRSDISQKTLGKCITEDIEDVHIKEIAKRAAWLGNDEVHYMRKWTEKDLSHLKSTITLVVNYIDSDIRSKKLLEDMPE